MPRVLLVDDENEFRESLSKRLKMRGFENLTLNSGVDVVKKIGRASCRERV